MLWVQLFLLIGLAVLLFPLLKVIASFIGHLGSTTSPTEKGFTVMADSIQSLLDEPRAYYWDEALSITVDSGYAIFGFDTDYEPTREFYPIYANEFMSTAYTPSDASPIMRPGRCPTGEACLCLVRMDEGLPAECFTCNSYAGNVTFAGVPYYREDLHTAHETPDIDGLKALYEDEGTSAWAPMNFGLLRQDKNQEPLQHLSRAGFSEAWYGWYGYLYIPGKIMYYEGKDEHGVDDSHTDEGIHTYYIEKFAFDDVDHVLVIPAYAENITRFGEELISTRTALLKREKEDIVADAGSHIMALASNLTEDRYLPLYRNCSVLERFRDVIPDACSHIDECVGEERPDSCRVDSTPCVCHAEGGDVICNTPYCYASGCATAPRDDTCG